MNPYFDPVTIHRTEIGQDVTIYRPTVRVRAFGPRGVVRYDGRLDTGADDTILPWSAIDDLGVQLLPGRSAVIEGLGGSERLMFGLVDLEFTGTGATPIRWSHLAAFSPSGRTLFGLNGFLDFFVARFDGVRHEVSLRYRGNAPPPRFVPPLPRRGR